MRFIILTPIIFFLFIGNAHAYVGPGLGLGVIGAVIGVIVAILAAIVGIIWYPVKRLLKRIKGNK